LVSACSKATLEPVDRWTAEKSRGGRASAPDPWHHYLGQLEHDIAWSAPSAAGEAPVPPEYRAAAEQLAGFDAADGDPADVFPFLSWVADNNHPGADGTSMVFKAIGQRRQWLQDELGEAYLDPTNIGELVKRGLAPEGYVTWQPDEGRILYTTKTIPEHVLDKLSKRLIQSSGLNIPAAEAAGILQICDMLTVGGMKYQMVLPPEVAATLNSFGERRAEGMFSLLI
jgi:hypothetical protein